MDSAIRHHQIYGLKKSFFTRGSRASDVDRVRQAALSSRREMLPPCSQVVITPQRVSKDIGHVDAVLIIDREAHFDFAADIDVCAFPHDGRYDEIPPSVTCRHESARDRHVGDLAPHAQPWILDKREVPLDLGRNE